MKRFSAILLALVVLCCSFAVAEEAPASEYEQITVGVFTKPTGFFFTSLWGNNTTDIDVRNLLHAYNLMHWDSERNTFTADPSVVTGMSITEDADGNRTYTLAISDDLYYSDGTRITAWDYAFTILLMSSPAMKDLGVSVDTYDYLTGMKEWQSGENLPILGVRVPDDSLLVLTVSKEYRPFFYELALLDVTPSPISVLAPGCTVRDNGAGVYLTGELTAETLRKTLLDEQTGYVKHPSVVSGPYQLTACDIEAGTASFEKNSYYKGNSEGELPLIKTIHLVTVSAQDYAARLTDGTVSLVHKVVSADAVTSGLQLAGQAEFAASNYTRSGLSMVSYCTEQPGMNDVTVRQAIAMCFDKTGFLAAYTGAFGLGVDGYYGIGQWLYQLATGVLTPTDGNGQPLDEATLAKWQALSLDGLTKYAYATDEAAAMLQAAGWKINADGLREKDGVVLDLNLVCFDSEKLIDAFTQYLQQPLAQVGIRLNITTVNTDELLDLYYRRVQRSCHMIFVGVNFTEVFDPSASYATGDDADLVMNTSALQDERLEALAVAMVSTQAGDLLTYTQRWIAFQEYWTKVLPAIPVYSNVYFDFYTSKLHGYDISLKTTWSRAILGAYLSDYTDAEALPQE